MIKKLTATLLLSGIVATTQAAIISGGTDATTLSAPFTVQHITVHGLQRIKRATLESYLPIKAGDKVDSEVSSDIIDDLYKSGLFANVTLTRQGNTLNINVVERPVLGNISIKGNKAVSRDELMKALNDAGITAGAEYNPYFIDEIRGALLQQYLMQGKYGAHIHTDVVHTTNNRVLININVDEGKALIVKQITVLGAHAFSEKTLIKQFKLTTPGITTFFTKDDVYANRKLEEDLQRLHFFYLDHGYLKYQLVSKEVGITPNKRQVYIALRIHEGGQYHLSGYKFTGKTILSQKALHKMTPFKTGDLFSRKQLMELQKKVIGELNEKGYARARINIVPKVDDKAHTVYLTFEIIPGNRIYVRHITFSGNYQTNDKVLRRDISQQEGGLSSVKKIHEESVHNLHMLPYVKQVQVITKPVPGHPNEEDVNYKITEAPAAAFTIQGGYQTVGGPTVGVSLNQKNFLGTGNTLGIGFNRDDILSSYNIDYFNPYFTSSGISQSVGLYYQKYDTDKLDTVEYSTDTAGGVIRYGFRASPRTRYYLGFGYDDTKLNVGSDPSTELQDFVNKHGKHFHQPIVTTGWSYTTLDRYFFPTKGWSESLGISVTVPVSEDSLRYYKSTYLAAYYQPVYHRSWILKFRGALGYANGYGVYADDMPFFKNFYAGGMDGPGAVRGYDAGSLGPRDSQNNAIGGNILLDGSAGLIFPNPLGQNIRTIWFVDGGNVFSSSLDGPKGHDLGIAGLELNELRYSTGIEVEWHTPFGATLKFSLARPIHDQKGDSTRVFAFSIGAGI